jgi:haloalkane dehalogenase
MGHSEIQEGVLRTPDDRFKDLCGYSFKPNYIMINDLRMHYLDEGPKESHPVLLLHGEPSWSYLYRKMIPPLTAAGHRVIAPDLIGFGRSDKFKDRKRYSYQFHVDMMTDFVRKLELANTTLFVQDWGGLIGLRVVAEEPDVFDRIVVSNTGLPDARGVLGLLGNVIFRTRVWAEGKVALGESWDDITLTRWVAYARRADDLPVGQVIQAATKTELTAEVLAGYEAPFPTADYKAAARVMPSLIASQLRANHRAWKRVLSKWEKPFLTAFSDGDPITRGMVRGFQERVPGAKGQAHVTIEGARHFVQEDKGEELAEVIIAFMKETS